MITEERVITVTLEQDVSPVLYNSLQQIEATLRAQQQANERRGKYGHDRVLAILNDVPPDGQMYVRGYEVSQEFLDNADYWRSDEELHMRDFIASTVAGGVGPADGSTKENPHSSHTRIDDTIASEIREISAAYGIRSQIDLMLPHECAIALVAGAPAGQYPISNPG